MSDSPAMTQEGMRRLVPKIQSLRTMPCIVQEILALLDSQDIDQRRLDAIVTRDTAFAARLLRMANSAHFAPRAPINSLSQAISVFGHSSLRSMALTNAVFGAMDQSETKFIARRFWEHAATMAYICREGAVILKTIDPEFAFIVGLIKDLGRLILVVHIPLETRKCIQASRRFSRSFHEMMLADYGIDDALVGGLLCRHWRFDERMIDAIENQYTPAEAVTPAVPTLCRYAEFICAFDHIQISGDNDEPPICLHHLPDCPFTSEQLIGLVQIRNQEIIRARALLDSMGA